MAPGPAPEVRRAAITTADSGRRSTDTTAALIPTPTAAVSENPGRWDAMTPPAAPRKIAGKVGPPRKPASEIDQAMPLKAISSASADSDHVAAPEVSGP